MPQNDKGRPVRGRTPARSSAPVGSRSPKHRGHRPEEAGAPEKKARWSRDERVERGHAADRGRGEAPGRFDRDERDDRRGGRDERPQRSADRDARPARGDARPYAARSGAAGRGAGARSGRPARDVSVERTGTGRTAHRPEWRPRTDDRPARGYDRAAERAPRSFDRDERAPRSFDRNDRAPRRDDRSERPARTERPARSFDRDDRAPRAFDRNDRAPRSFDRTERPARSFDRDERAPRRDDRSERPARSFDRSERPTRSFDREDRAPRRDSDFYPTRATSSSPQDDVVLERLEADAVQATDVEGVSFADLGLGGNIVRTLAELGASSPFPIQAATIPDVLAGRDVLGRGRTGSGKTIAFGAPLVERLMENGGGKKREMGRKPRALILAPTRELALQIDGTIQPIARSVGLFTTQIYGGVPQGRQVGALQRGVDIIIGTPGRIEDLIEQGRLDLSAIEIVVLDEADHMCELGFLEPVQRIIRETRRGGQRLLFSATLDSGVANLVTEFLRDPAVYEVAGEDQDSSTIDHRILLVEQRDKRAIIEQLAGGAGKTLVFARTRAFAEELAEQLDDAGIAATSLHGDLNQRNRQRNLDKLTSGRASVLVATDVAARGIHVDDISLVVQADAPDEYKTYLHRSGRTGRAGKVGTVVTLITKPRRRRFEELLARAEITATTDEVRVGDALLDELAAL
ncbi:DEAD/DEAH box helicase [Microcella daejeonensis]|uniref:DEAD/DEAH box helicase n=1 Tax=Microcella daejeonensis TaxID=2994971 RepID=A0A9E8SA33_9MICO|nr:DEAD/DEAH box helicase [Microcella daejeonensis]WAB82161.1 DEAD/DEAH box helicase [Microcella daejeonensis]